MTNARRMGRFPDAMFGSHIRRSAGKFSCSAAIRSVWRLSAARRGHPQCLAAIRSVSGVVRSASSSSTTFNDQNQKRRYQ